MIPKEIQHYYESIDISSSYSTMTGIISGASREYIDGMSDGMLDQIGANRKVRHILELCSASTRSFYGKYYSDAPIILQVRVWSHEYCRYLYCTYGRASLEALCHQPAAERRLIMEAAREAASMANDDYRSNKKIYNEWLKNNKYKPFLVKQ